MAEINLVLTGELDDGPHPCVSEVIRRWVIGVQDAMPDSVRNSAAWREAAIGIAGSVSTENVERARVDLLLTWMWEALADPSVLAAVPEGARPAWSAMLSLRTAEAATATRAARAPARAAARAAWVATAARAAWAATAATAARAASAAWEAWAAEAAEAAAWAAAAATERAEFWERRDPAGMLAALIAMNPTVVPES